MNGEKSGGLVLPRPNLGPEPWREPDPSPRLLLGLGVAAAALLLGAWAWRRARWRDSRPIGTKSVPPGAEPTPRDRMVGLSETIRDALTAQFGVSFRAKTTQELAVDERLAQLLGGEGFRELMEFLDRIDLLKFAPERPERNGGELDEALKAWEPRVATLAARIRVKPRARPRARAGGTPPSSAVPAPAASPAPPILR